MNDQVMVRRSEPSLVLAPMEGVTDAPMRRFFSEQGGFSYFVTEFLRISHAVPTLRTIRRHAPEFVGKYRLRSHEKQNSWLKGLPLQLQLLGGDPEHLAEAAVLGCYAGAGGIDLNFGCPAPTVNRHDGGASLLKHPLRIRSIVAAVRAAVPAEIPVSAKLRLGWASIDDIYENAAAAAEGGADWITIHGRTREQGYRLPAYWGPIGEVQRRLGLPVVANGEIWTLEDFKRCRDETRCEHFMIGRGALANPALPAQIARELGLPWVRHDDSGEADAPHNTDNPAFWLPLMRRFAAHCDLYAENPQYSIRRLKQWLWFINLAKPRPWIAPLRRVETTEQLLAGLALSTNNI